MLGISFRCNHRCVTSCPSLLLHTIANGPLGPYCANIFDPRSWGDGSSGTVNAITLEFTRVVLAIGVFAIGVELPKAYMKRHWKSLFFLLFPVMTWVCCSFVSFSSLISCAIGVVCLRRFDLCLHSRPQLLIKPCCRSVPDAHRSHPCCCCRWW